MLDIWRENFKTTCLKVRKTTNSVEIGFVASNLLAKEVGKKTKLPGATKVGLGPWA